MDDGVYSLHGRRYALAVCDLHLRPLALRRGSLRWAPATANAHCMSSDLRRHGDLSAQSASSTGYENRRQSAETPAEDKVRGR